MSFGVSTRQAAALEARPLPVLALSAAAAAGLLIWTATAAAALPSTGYADLVETVSPAVVFIAAKQGSVTGDPAPDEAMPLPFGRGSPLDDFLNQFRSILPRQAIPTTALGSGFLINADGDVVTNNHVIDGATEIEVTLADGRHFDGRVVGTDPQTDTALVHVEAAAPLPFVSFGDSDAVRTGDVVIAVGNPFGLGGTVTAGIVSARGRNINAGPYDDFIQTDAAINHGNSGGPMFDTAGRVVGVNTAIFSPNGGSVGIGFAIPSNIVKAVVAQLKTSGAVERGYLGVKVQEVTPDIARALHLDKPRGALVIGVEPDSPAAAAGLRQGDLITGFAGAPIADWHQLPRLVAAHRVGEAAAVTVLRDGKTLERSVTVARLPGRETSAALEAPSNAVEGHRLGVVLAPLTDALRARIDAPKDLTGALVVRIDPAGRAARYGIEAGDVIVRVNGRSVQTVSDVSLALGKETDSVALLLINRRGDELFIGIRLDAA